MPTPRVANGSASTDTPTGLAPELLRELRPVPGAALSKTRSLYLGLYAAITDGRLPAESRLPPSRELAAALGLGRNTVTTVYEQLAAERLVTADGRRGTRVAALGVAPALPPRSPATRSPVRLSSRSALAAAVPGRARDFAPGEPDASLFPRRRWAAALARAAALPARELGYRGAPLPALQAAIARWLATRRSLVVAPERIVVTSGTRQSLLLAGLLFADPGESAWVESPGYVGATDAFASLGLRPVACAVDAGGLVPPPLRAGRGTGPSDVPAIVYLTPCFQYPTGVPLSPERRAALLALSARHGTVLFEDDYDSEFRGDDEPRPALGADMGADMGADAREHGATVASAGTFSKLAFPAARVGWLVVPPGCADRAEACLRTLGGGHNAVAQAAAAQLLDDATIARHVERTRAVYRHRRTLLLEALRGATHLSPVPGAAGSLSLVVRLARPAPVVRLETALARAGFGAVPLERFVTGSPPPRRCRHLVLGLGNVDALAMPSRLDGLDAVVGSVANVTG